MSVKTRRLRALRRYRGKYTQLSEEMTNVRALNTELLARNAELVGGSAVDRKAIQALQDDLQEGREHCDAQSNWIANLTGAREAQARRILELEDERGDLADAVRSLEDRLKSERLARERSELALERTQAEIGARRTGYSARQNHQTTPGQTPTRRPDA